jgi:ubiquinone/menaquinone biosynthesis C-methylase UbiE
MAEVFVAKWYHLLLYPDWLRRLHQRPRKFLFEFIKPGIIAADIGCGLGFYTVEMARMVGEKGRIIAIDFQPEMLRFTEKKASKASVSKRVETIQCTKHDLIVSEHVDFALSMWVAHEVLDRHRFFRQICDMLKPDGKYLLSEPKLHVGKELYRAICDDAEEAGLQKISEPEIGGSRSAVFVAV